MIAPVHKLTKPEIVKLANRYCKHGHTMLEHYSCYEAEHNYVERVGFFDIEASNLDANFGQMLAYCIKDGSSDKIYSGVITNGDIKKYPADQTDKRIVEECVKDLMRFDRVATHYGRRFDMPFLRTRALMCDVPFPPYNSLCLDDTWRWARDKLKLNSNRLEVVCRTILGNTDKTHIDYKHWIAGARGNAASLKYILKHCKFDVLDLEKVWRKLRDYININKSSI